MSRKKVLVLNRSNSDNLGDQAISLAISQLLSENDVEHITHDLVLQQPRNHYGRLETSTNEARKIRSVYLSRLKWILKNFRQIKRIVSQKFDIVMIGGGQLINSNMYFPVAVWLWTTMAHRSSKSKIVFFGVGCDRSFTHIEKFLYKSALKKASSIVVRDEDSKENIQTLFKLSSKSSYDVVFSMHIQSVKQVDDSLVLLGPTSIKRFKKYNTHITQQEYHKKWIDIIQYELNLHHRVLLFYTTAEDYKTCMQIQDLIKSELDIIVPIASIMKLDDLIAVISTSRKVISQRMHALILGYICGCELEPILISPKLQTFKKIFLDQKQSLQMIQDDIEESLREILTL